MRMRLFCVLYLGASLSGLAQSPDKAAFQRNLQFAQMGQSSAEVIVGQDYLRGAVVGTNFQAAREWFQKASDARSVDADAWLASMAIHGQGVPRDQPGGIQKLQTAFAAGSAKASLFLAQD